MEDLREALLGLIEEFGVPPELSERQVVLDQPDTDVNIVLSESAVRRRVGSADVMREQLTHLLAVAERPNVSVQVLPFDAETFDPAPYSFIVLRFGIDETAEVIYVETATDGGYLDSPEALRAYNRMWSRVQAAALGPVESRRLIEGLLTEKS